MIRERSKYRLIWDCLVLILILISCTTIPYQLVFQNEGQTTGLAFLYVIDAIFVIDILQNFFTSYSARGAEVTERRLTVRHYLRGSFGIDLVANIPLYLVALVIGDPQVYGLSSVMLFRLPQLLRVTRLFVILRRWEALSWTNSGYLRIIKYFGFVGLLVHWIACAWFLAAFSTGFSQDSWVVRTGIDALAPAEQYVRSLYWTIATMTTVGYGDITPGHTAEYVVASIVMVMGASLYAFLIGGIASLLSNLNVAYKRHKERVQSVTQYLHDRHVPRELHDRVRDYYDYLWERDRGIKEAKLLEDLPTPLRLDIVLHLARNILNKVPLFQYCSDPLRDTLLMSLELQTYPPDSYLAREGEPGKQVYFVAHGRMEILSSEDGQVHGELSSGDYFGYMSMVLGEKRTASIKTLTYCDVFTLSYGDFNIIRDEFPEFGEILKRMSAENTDRVSKMVMDGIVL